MCYITRDLRAAELSLRLPLCLPLAPLCPAPLHYLSAAFFQAKGQVQIKPGKKDKDGGHHTRTLFTSGVSQRVHFNVSHLDVCWRCAYRSSCCITKAESGLKAVRKEQIECMLFLVSVHPSSFQSLSLCRAAQNISALSQCFDTNQITILT